MLLGSPIAIVIHQYKLQEILLRLHQSTGMNSTKRIPMVITKQQISDSLFDAIVMNDLYEISDENVEEVIDTIADYLYHELILKNRKSEE